ncbi:MAG TPA: aquaporin [Gemmatimonadaceae bacterium]|nr:aquaporin [Gemmatimonadaceae bacterium]
MRPFVRHFVAEFVGIFALVFVGGGAIMMAARTNPPGSLLAIALAHGLILALMVSATMNVSGGHLNPAVTLGFLVARRITPVMAAVHVAAQLVGAVFGALALKWFMPAELFNATRAGGQSVALDVAMSQAIGLEVVAAFFLMFVIYGTAVNDVAPKLGGMAIGLTIAADILAIGPLTGASMNPARSFGPALVTGLWEGQIVYWAGPIIGMIVGALVWEFVLLRREPAVPRDS